MIQRLSLGFSLLFFAAQVVFPHAAQANLWKERQRQSQLARLPLRPASLASTNALHQLPPVKSNESITGGMTKINAKHRHLAPLLSALPARAGSIQSIFVPLHHNTGQVVIHIQDVHKNTEAQMNIAKALESLIHKEKVDVIALEAAFDSFDFSGLVELAKDPLLNDIAAHFLEKHMITGPIYTALRNPDAMPPVVGIDDPAHYAANVNAYKRSHPKKDGMKETLSRAQMDLYEKKKTIFNNDLSAFDEKVQAYRDQKITMGRHLAYLTRHTMDVPLQIEIFLEALELENRLDFDQVEQERALLLDRLVKKLSQAQMKSLLNASVAYRVGNIRHAEFYEFISRLCEMNDISITRYPAMRDYLQYVLLSDSIDAQDLFKAVRTLEEERYSILISSKKEKELVRRSRALYLKSKLVDFALTKEEWDEYKESMGDSWRREHGDIRPPSLKGGDGQTIPPAPPLFQRKRQGTAFRSFEAFYQEAEYRDAAIAQNLIRQMKNKKAKVAVLVTGGFHNQGISTRLHEAGLTTISYAPKITRAETEKGSAYLSVFTQETATLDELFKGDRLFLGDHPVGAGGGTHFSAIAGLYYSAAKNTLNAARVRLMMLRFALTNKAKQIFKAASPKISHTDGIVTATLQGLRHTARVTVKPSKIADSSVLVTRRASLGTRFKNVIATLISSLSLFGTTAQKTPDGVPADVRPGSPVESDESKTTVQSKSLLDRFIKKIVGSIIKINIFPLIIAALTPFFMGMKPVIIGKIAALHDLALLPALSFWSVGALGIVGLAGLGFGLYKFHQWKWVRGLLFLSTLPIKLGKEHGLDEAIQSIQNRIRYNHNQVRTYLKQAATDGRAVFIKGLLRGVDGAGSSLDLPFFQLLLTRFRKWRIKDLPSTITITTNMGTSITFEALDKPNKPIFLIGDFNPKTGKYIVSNNLKTDQDENPENWIEYVNEDLFDTMEPRAFHINQIDAFNDSNLSLKYQGAAWILYKIFKLKGIRIRVQGLPEVAKSGGFESSNLFMVSLLTGASILTGVGLSKADILALAVKLEVDVFQNTTGGQGHLASLMGGMYKHIWLTGMQEHPLTRGQFGAFSVPVYSQRQMGRAKIEINNHIMLAQAGKTPLGSNSKKYDRVAQLTNLMWTDLLKGNGSERDDSLRDPIAYPLYQRYIYFVHLKEYYLKKYNWKKVQEIEEAYVQIRDEITKRWIRLAMAARKNQPTDPDADRSILRLKKLPKEAPLPNYSTRFAQNIWPEEFGLTEERIEDDYRPVAHIIRQFIDDYENQAQDVSLYTYDPISILRKKALNEDIVIFPLGAGGPGANLMAVSHKGKEHIRRFFIDQGWHELTQMDDADIRGLKKREAGDLRGFQEFKMGEEPLQINGFNGLEKYFPEEPKDMFYNQATNHFYQPNNRWTAIRKITQISAVLLFAASLIGGIPRSGPLEIFLMPPWIFSFLIFVSGVVVVHYAISRAIHAFREEKRTGKANSKFSSIKKLQSNFIVQIVPFVLIIGLHAGILYLGGNSRFIYVSQFLGFIAGIGLAALRNLFTKDIVQIIFKKLTLSNVLSIASIAGSFLYISMLNPTLISEMMAAATVVAIVTMGLVFLRGALNARIVSAEVGNGQTQFYQSQFLLFYFAQKIILFAPVLFLLSLGLGMPSVVGTGFLTAVSLIVFPIIIFSYFTAKHWQQPMIKTFLVLVSALFIVLFGMVRHMNLEGPATSPQKDQTRIESSETQTRSGFKTPLRFLTLRTFGATFGLLLFGLITQARGAENIANHADLLLLAQMPLTLITTVFIVGLIISLLSFIRTLNQYRDYIQFQKLQQFNFHGNEDPMNNRRRYTTRLWLSGVATFLFLLSAVGTHLHYKHFSAPPLLETKQVRVIENEPGLKARPSASPVSENETELDEFVDAVYEAVVTFVRSDGPVEVASLLAKSRLQHDLGRANNRLIVTSHQNNSFDMEEVVEALAYKLELNQIKGSVKPEEANQFLATLEIFGTTDLAESDLIVPLEKPDSQVIQQAVNHVSPDNTVFLMINGSDEDQVDAFNRLIDTQFNKAKIKIILANGPVIRYDELNIFHVDRALEQARFIVAPNARLALPAGVSYDPHAIVDGSAISKILIATLTSLGLIVWRAGVNLKNLGRLIRRLSIQA